MRIPCHVVDASVVVGTTVSPATFVAVTVPPFESCEGIAMPPIDAAEEPMAPLPESELMLMLMLVELEPVAPASLLALAHPATSAAATASDSRRSGHEGARPVVRRRSRSGTERNLGSGLVATAAVGGRLAGRG